KECADAHFNYKRALLDADENATTVIKRSLGTPARALKNDWTSRILELEEKQSTYEDLKDYISGEANKRYIYDGEDTAGFGWAGQIAARITSVPSVDELINTCIKEAEAIRDKWK